MTRMGQTLVIACLCALAVATAIQSRPAMAATLAMGIYLIIDGAIFFVQRKNAMALKVRRHFANGAEHGVVFCGKTSTVSLDVSHPGKQGSLIITLNDRIPAGLTVTGNNGGQPWTIPAGGRHQIRYTLQGDHMGTFRFPGFTWSLSSPCGLWRTDRFVPLPGSLRVVPDIFGKFFLQPWHKQKNILLRHGRHQQRRAGLGAELLSLRAYQPGDPIKTIAWRISAKKDRLITKDFENEVPVKGRILFQPAIRFWSGHPPAITHAVTFLAKLAKILAEHRDLVEFICPRPEGNIRTGTGLTRRHLAKLLNAMGEAITAPAAVPGRLSSHELHSIFQEAFCCAPDLQEAANCLVRQRWRLSLLLNQQKTATTLLSLFLSAHFRLGMGAVPILEQNAGWLGYFSRLFAAQQGLQYQPGENAIQAWANTTGPRWGRLLFTTLNRLIQQAKDEELYVVMADFAILGGRDKQRFQHLLRKGRALGHRFVIYWPRLTPQNRVGASGARAVETTQAFQNALRSLDIPARDFDPAGGFLPILQQLKLLKKQTGVRTW